jgi:hypothetical protein
MRMSKQITFSDQVNFHLSGKVNRHNIQIWGSKKPVAVVEMEYDSPKVNMFCVVSRRFVQPVLLCGEECYGKAYLKYKTG